MNETELLRRFPNASKSTIERNCHPKLAPDAAPVRAIDPQPAKRRSLVNRVSRKETGGPRFEIVFTVYATRPADWDGYSIKALQDMLVRSGILSGDSWNTLQGRVISAKAEREDLERTEITINALLS